MIVSLNFSSWQPTQFNAIRHMIHTTEFSANIYSLLNAAIKCNFIRDSAKVVDVPGVFSPLIELFINSS